MSKTFFKIFNKKDFKLNIFQGNPFPLGATHDNNRFNFSVFSKNGEAVTIVFFAPGIEEPKFELELDPLINKTGDLWHVGIEGLENDFRYGYKIKGEYNPSIGHYFDDSKILIDPYSKAISGGSTYGVSPKGSKKNNIHYNRRSFIPEDDLDWENDRPLRIPLSKTIIYEVHLRGYTIHESSKVKHPGTFKGLIEKIPYLKELGITAVELMPVNEFDEFGNSFKDPETGENLKKYWGYNPYAFFAPKASYAATGDKGGQVVEFKEMVKALHKAGIEIIIDVVFNHTDEGDGNGPTYSFRGFDNSIYYMLNENADFMNYSGCGNTVNCNHPVVRNMIIDSLRHWVTEFHVDGFRFDLASILGRGMDGSVLNNPPLLESIAADPLLADTKLIAEAWDAAGLYQVGSFPAWGKWAEWNGKYRDDIRGFLKGDEDSAGAFATRLSGSSDLYQSSGRTPSHSINFITSHDGFTMHDLVSYSDKHNLNNGEDNRDGDNNNMSYNWGEEGETENPQLQKLRTRLIKNAMVLLFMSQGTPMLLAGDEFRRTQKGNNNAYCQDNDISWVDWSFENKNKEMMEFIKNLISLRKSHSVLQREYFFNGTDDKHLGYPDISWHGRQVFKPDFSTESKAIAALIFGRYSDDEKENKSLFIATNMSHRATSFEIPRLPMGNKWYVKIDTHAAAPNDFFKDGAEKIYKNRRLFLYPRSITVLVSD